MQFERRSSPIGSRSVLRRPSARPGSVQSTFRKPDTGIFGERGSARIRPLLFKERIRKRSTVIPGTKRRFKPKEMTKILQEELPYKKVRTHLSKREAKRILRGLRTKEDRLRRYRKNFKEAKALRDRRLVLGEKWGIKKY